VPLAGGPALELAASQMIRNPEWMPDGGAIVFESDAHSFRDLYRVDRTGGDPVRLTETEQGTFEPTVSADGQWLAFGTSRDGNAEVYVSRSDGSAPRRLTNDNADDVAPAFLPDGRLSWISWQGGTPTAWVMS